MSLCPVDEESSPPYPNHSLLETVAAPWRHSLRPKRAAGAFLTARWDHLAASYLFAMLVLSATATLHYFVTDALKKQTGVGLVGPVFEDDNELPAIHHSFWDSFRNPVLQYRATFLFLLLPLGVSGLALFMAWLLLPIVHVDGGVGRSFGIGLRGIASGAGFLIVSSNLLGVSYHIWHAMAATDRIIDSPGGFVGPLGFCVTLIALLHWLSVALRSIRTAIVPQLPPMRCEGCGYDLTHRSPSGRCTECGLAIDESITPQRRRNRVPVSVRTGMKPWVWFSMSHLLTGQNSYTHLAVRQDSGLISRFCHEHLVAIGSGAALWIGTRLVVALLEDVYWGRQTISPPLVAGVFLLLCGSLVVSLAAWGLHRIVGAVMSSYWFARGMFPVPGVAETVICLETPFLWAFCFFNGTLITSFTFFDDWITQSFGWQFWNVLLGIPSEPAVMLIGNAALIVCWMVRMHRAFLAVRWANY